MIKCKFPLLAALAAAAFLNGCAQPVAPVAPESAAAEPVELVVFAAASMTESMEEIAGLYRAVAPNVTIAYNFDSSGTLKTQIEAGADCDIFISAAQKQMDALDASKDAESNPGGLDFVLQGTRFDLVGNAVVMIVPEASAKGISDFSDVFTDRVSLVALGNGDVPVGQYSEEIYTALGRWDELKHSGKVTYGSNVKEVLALVSEGAVDCGVVYGTDAATAQGVKVVARASADSHGPITYPAAVLNTTAHAVEAKAFLAYLQTDACGRVFADIGFVIPER